MGSQLSLIWPLACCPVFIKTMKSLQSWNGCLPDYHRVAPPLPGDTDKLFTSSRQSPVRARWWPQIPPCSLTPRLTGANTSHLDRHGSSFPSPICHSEFEQIHKKNLPQSFQFIIDFIFVQKGNKMLWFCLGKEFISCSINYKENIRTSTQSLVIHHDLYSVHTACLGTWKFIRAANVPLLYVHRATGQKAMQLSS